MKCGYNHLKDLYGNFVLSGWMSTCPGVNTRLEKELIPLAPPTIKSKVVTLPS